MATAKTGRKIRRDSIGSSLHHHHQSSKKNHDSLSYENSESDAHRAAKALDMYQHRGKSWNTVKHERFVRYILTALVGILQACVAYFMKLISSTLISYKFEAIYLLLEEKKIFWAFVQFLFLQTFYAALASACVMIEPISAGSGIPEVKCFLNGIDLPNVGAFRTLLCKVTGVIFSVSAGLPVGSEGPMVHSGAVVATTLSQGSVRNDREVRDFVACGAAAGVCTAFSAPIGGILFALEEGASYWGPSLTWRTFFCSMCALTTLYMLNTIGSAMGKVGFNKLFSFGNFIYEGTESSFHVYELFVFMAIGIVGGLIGAVFNNTNEKITHWRIKNVNKSKKRRFLEVICVSILVSFVTFMLPLAWNSCKDLPEDPLPVEIPLLEELVQFQCGPGQYNEVASLIFTEAGVAIRQLFHLHKHAFSDAALLVFFIFYISLAVVVYGIAVPSGLFVPSLLSGAAFGRLFGNLAATKFTADFAFSNTYALVGAAAVLGGMARMTISLTVILLECTGNEQFVLPLMLTLMFARLTGGIFNDDLYHIHIHLKPGVKFLEAELDSGSANLDLIAGQVMGENVIFLQPVEKVSVVVDVLESVEHTTFPIVDKENDGTIFGTITRNELCALLKNRSFGHKQTTPPSSFGLLSDHISYHGTKYVPILMWNTVEGAYPKYPSVKDLRLSPEERGCFMDLRPYANIAPVTVQENAPITRVYEVFRSLGLRFLAVVNRKNQVVGTITRSDLSPDGLARTLLEKGKKHV